MATNKTAALEAYRRKTRAALRAADEQFKGEYAEELSELLGLSQDEVDKITPDGADLQAYHQLITVVEVASSQNASQAQLRSQIEALGQTAVAIAKKVGPLAKMFLK